MSGTFGYELDLTSLSKEEKEEIKQQIQQFQLWYPLIQYGNYYRLTNAIEDRYFTAWEFASTDKTEALLNIVILSQQENPTPIHILSLIHI